MIDADLKREGTQEDAMDNPSSNYSQPDSNQILNSTPTGPHRRNRAFPVHFRVRRDERGKPTESQMYYANEWEELQKQEADAECAREESKNSERAAHEAELAASRPLESTGGYAATEEQRPEYQPFAGRTATAKSTLVASNPTPHVLSRVPPDYERHTRLCSICSHPDRDAIEGDFVRWRKPAEIIDDYGLPNRYALYRHAHACGLYQRREVELARVLEKQLENADDCPLERFDVITRAVRAHAHLDGHGRWFEPPRIHHVLTGPLPTQSELVSTSLPNGATAADPPPTFDISVSLPNPR